MVRSADAQPGVLSQRELAELFDAVLAVGSQLSLDAVLGRIVESAVTLLDARYGALGVLDEGHTRLVEFINVGFEREVADAIGHLPEGHGILGRLIVDPVPLRLADLGTHPDRYGFPPHHPPMRSFLGVPIHLRDEVFGNLYLTEKRGDAEFSETDEAMAVALAATAGMAIENARLHARLGELRVVEDRERIARDLHDTVIQRIFATGLSLEGIAGRVDDEGTAQRLRELTDDLDDTVRHIRTTIFGLHRSRLPGRSARREVLELVGELATAFGLTSAVRFDGPVDTVLGGPDGVEVVDAALAVVREALTNVGRHARARRVDVAVTATDATEGGTQLVVAISDDGVGFSPTRAGDGLANLSERAAALRGSCQVGAGPAGGTTVVWQVPLG